MSFRFPKISKANTRCSFMTGNKKKCFFSKIGILIFFILGRIVYCDNDIDDLTYEEYNDYVHLVSDVQEYYKASSVFIIYAGDDESIRTTNLMMHLIRKFSRKFVLSLTLNYTDVTRYDDHYRGRIIRPLFVVVLNTPTEVERFKLLTKQCDMSHPFWLVIFTEYSLHKVCNKPIGNYFNIAFDTEMMVKCFGDPIIWEWYSIDGYDTRMKKLAIWDTIDRFRLLTNMSLYERRHTFEGKVLRIATVKDSPFITASLGPLSGLFATILAELSSTLNFTYTIAYQEDAYGSLSEKTGEWSGVIGRLVKREVDLGVAEFTMSNSRLDVVDFTLPIMLSRNNLYMRQPDGSALQWSAYFRVYTFDVWMIIEAIVLLATLVITYIRITVREKPIPPNHVAENFLHIIGLYCQQGLPDFPTSSSLRIAYFSILVSSVVFLAVYSACLISYLTVTSPSLPFSSMFQFANDGSYKLIAFQESADYAMFATATDEVLKKMMKQMLEPKYLPKTMMAGFRMACQDKIAFYATEAVKSQTSGRIPCDLVFLVSGRIDSLGMTLTKRSQYTGVINYHLQKFKDVGIMSRLRSQAYVKVTKSDNKYNPVNVRGIVTILLIIGIGMIISLIILAIEIYIYRCKIAEENRLLMSTCKTRIVVTKNSMIVTPKRITL